MTSKVFFIKLNQNTGKKMRFSTKSRFAVAAMIDIALREESGSVSLADIGLRHQVSLSYLEQIFSLLRQKGLVNSCRGPGGGYQLNLSMDAITVADIISAVEDQRPTAKQQLASQAQDLAHDLWETMNTRLVDFMKSVTLRNLVVEQLAKGVKIEQKSSFKRGVFERPDWQPIQTNVPNSVFALGRSALAVI